MARNAERSMAMLNRWVSMKQTIVKGVARRRPRNTQECDNLKDAEYWRSQVVREVSRKIAEIQNAGLGEHRIRDLNDEINFLLKQKYRWELRIKELNGPDYTGRGGFMDLYGNELMARSDYKYFGAAKDLPGVRELFESEAPPPPRKTGAQLSKSITPDYYGWRDEEDSELLIDEQQRETELRALGQSF